MELKAPWLIRICSPAFEPLCRLQDVLAESTKRNDALRIVSTSFVDGIKEDVVKFVQLCSCGISVTRRLVECLENQLRRFTPEPRSYLRPQGTEFRFDESIVRSRRVQTCPLPRVMMDVKNSIESTREGLIDDLLDAVHPGGIDSPGSGVGHEMMRPCYGDTNALKPCSFDIVEGLSSDWAVVPGVLVGNRVEAVSEVPSWVQASKSSRDRDWCECCCACTRNCAAWCNC